MNGLIVINKLINWTSRDVVNKLNKLLNTKKIGHTGTLDPIAEGVLVCLVGKYTKLGNLLTSIDKEYVAEIKLGLKTDTLDITGEVIEQKEFQVTKDQIAKVFKEFPKRYRQTVPLYSAVKIQGKRLYAYAHQNQKVDLPQREVQIYALELLDFHDDIIKFKVKVSKGTYIRSLIQDICTNLNTYGTMQSLVRTKQGKFNIENAFTLENVEKGQYKLLNVKEFLDYPIIELNDEEYKIIDNGHKIENKWQITNKVIFTYQNKDIAIYEVKERMLQSYLKL